MPLGYTRVVGGASTYSKALFCDVEGYPKKAITACDSMVTSDDGREFIDWTAALGAVILGYKEYFCYSPPSLPLPTNLEESAAAKFCDIAGWDQVRFCKNGSDATEAAVRLARFVTSRDEIIATGYHGSHSDLVTSTPGKCGGVVGDYINAVTTEQELLTLLEYERSACVITEPYVMGSGVWDWQKIKEVCEQTGALLIFDEVITGFRCRAGSMHPDVRPDLACYGKAIANGMPLALIAGPRHLMKYFEKDVFMSATAAGEQASLSACLQVLGALTPEAYMRLEGNGLVLGAWLKGIVRGYPQRWQITLPDDTHRKFVGALAKRDILVGRDFFSMASHTTEQVTKTCEAILEVRQELGI